MDPKAKKQIEKTIRKNNQKLVKDVLKEYRNLGPLQGSMVVSALNDAKTSIVQQLLPIHFQLGATPKELIEWIEELFKEEINKYVRL